MIDLAILISGSGRTLVNIDDRIRAGTLAARIRVVVASRLNIAGIDRAKERGLRVVVVPRKELSDEAFDRAVAEAVEGADLVCMAGFLPLWRIPERWMGRVINIHPALLPEFGGQGMHGPHVHQAVLDAGRAVSGCTVHFCDNEFDHGPVILQRTCPVMPGDTAEMLAARVFELECEAYPEAIQMFAEGRVMLVGTTVEIEPTVRKT